MKLNDKLYDILKWIVMIVLPACGTLYTALGAVWGFPLTEEVTATLGAVNTFLGVLIGVSTIRYNKEG